MNFLPVYSKSKMCKSFKMMSSNVALLHSNNCCVLEPAICEDLDIHVVIFFQGFVHPGKNRIASCTTNNCSALFSCTTGNIRSLSIKVKERVTYSPFVVDIVLTIVFAQFEWGAIDANAISCSFSLKSVMKFQEILFIAGLFRVSLFINWRVQKICGNVLVANQLICSPVT